jgi:hypothetical protein
MVFLIKEIIVYWDVQPVVRQIFTEVVDGPTASTGM